MLKIWPKTIVYAEVLVRKVNSFFAWLWLAWEGKTKICGPWGNRENKKDEWYQFGAVIIVIF